MMLIKPQRRQPRQPNNRSRGPRLAAFCALLTATQAAAASRTYIVTDYDSLRIEGPLNVTVETGRGASARGEGDRAALDLLDLQVSARVLTVRLKSSSQQSPRSVAAVPTRLMLTAPVLRRIQMAGAGSLRADGLEKSRADVSAAGSGHVDITGIDSDILWISQSGSGSITLAGKAKTVRLKTTGSGKLDASALRSADLDIAMDGQAVVEAQADRAALIVAAGAGSATVAGRPACTIRQVGSGVVRCGDKGF